MAIKAEDFPVYQRLVELNGPGIARAKNDFAAGQSGGDEAAYNFALGIQTVAAIPGIENQIPGLTTGMVEKTLQSCLAVFEDVASRGHTNSRFMVGDFKARGLGQKRPRGASGPA
jgi:hypothetical protein